MAYVNGKRNSLLGIRTVTKSEYDLVITSEDIFSECLYPLFKNEENLTKEETIAAFQNGTAVFGAPTKGFTAKTILVRGVTFKTRRGYDDVRLHIFQPSIEYIRFENCRWETEWYVSGARPTVIAKTQFERAEGNFNLIIDGIEVTEDNIQTAVLKGVTWYIGLRNIKTLINSDIRYPEDYDIKNGWNFKFSCQYFDYANNNRLYSLWDGVNVSDCYIVDKLVRCVNCANVKASPVLNNGVLESVTVKECTNIVNFDGDFTYENCVGADFWISGGHKFAVKSEAVKGCIPLRDDRGNIRVPTEQTSETQALSFAMAKTRFPLLTNGKVSASCIPSEFNEVIEADSKSFTTSGAETGKIYVTTDTNRMYRWNGSKYIELSSYAKGEIDSKISGINAKIDAINTPSLYMVYIDISTTPEESANTSSYFSHVCFSFLSKGEMPSVYDFSTFKTVFTNSVPSAAGGGTCVLCTGIYHDADSSQNVAVRSIRHYTDTIYVETADFNTTGNPESVHVELKDENVHIYSKIVELL